MPKVTFDGENRRIDVLPGVVQIDVARDLYSAWKEWLIEDPINMRWLQAFRSAGGDPTNLDATQFSPRYFFLMNGWRVYIANGNVIDVQLNLYTDNPDGIIYVTSNNSGVNARTSDAAVVLSEVQQALEYNQAVYVDLDSPHSGQQYPYGLFAQPVNNLEDAIAIANHYGFNRVFLRGAMTLDIDLEGMELHSWTGYSEINLTGTSIENSEFYGLFINGDFGPNRAALFDQCFIRPGTTSVDGFFRACTFSGHFTLRPGGKFHTFQSYCDGEDWPIMDMHPDPEASIDMNIKGWMGRLSVRNFNGPNKRAIIGFNNGRIRMESSCTAGFLSISGIPWAALIDLMDPDPNNRTQLERSAMLPSHQQLNEALQKIDYGSEIYISSERGTPGMTYPSGTSSSPVNNFEDALALAESYDIQKFIIEDYVVIDKPILNRHYTFKGITGFEQIIFIGQPVGVSLFENLTLIGDMNIQQGCIIRHCQIMDIERFDGLMDRCVLINKVGLKEGSNATVVESISISYWEEQFDKFDAEFVFPEETQENLLLTTLNVRGFMGAFSLDNMTSEKHRARLHMNKGRLKINETCLLGMVGMLNINRGWITDLSGPNLITNFNDLGDDVSDFALQRIRERLAQKYNGDIELGSIDHILDRLDKNTQK